MIFYRKFIVRKHERGLLFKQGDFVRFLEPGIHRMFDPLMRLAVNLHDIASPQFEHRLADLFINHYVADVERLFVKVETRDHEIAVIFENGHFADVMGPDQRELFWKGVVDVTAQLIDVADTYDVEPRLAKALVGELKGNRVALNDKAVYMREVPDGHVGLLFVDGKLVRELAPGLHVFWKFIRGINVALVDLRVRALEVGGQEILTKDKVALRIRLPRTRWTSCIRSCSSVCVQPWVPVLWMRCWRKRVPWTRRSSRTCVTSSRRSASRCVVSVSRTLSCRVI